MGGGVGGLSQPLLEKFPLGMSSGGYLIPFAPQPYGL